LQQLEVKSGQRVVVFGSGGNGLAFVRFATLMGAQVVLVGSPSRFERATKLGAIACLDYRQGDKLPDAIKGAFGGAGADVAIEAVGAAGHVQQCILSLTRGGKLFIFGITPECKCPANLFTAPGDFRVILKGCAEWQAHGQVLTHYLSGEIKVEDFCDATLPLEKINDAVAAIRRKQAIKICLTMPE
jgi:threonine dehydrogenase-like Zn-dependent dehydrogenase